MKNSIQMSTYQWLVMVALTLGLTGSLKAQPTAFTFQGRLNSAAGPANGSYDLQFVLYNTNTSGSVIAGPITNLAVAISNGLFTAALDFGPGVFTGTNYWVEIGVRTNGGGAFSTLAPRQQLTPAPAAFSLSVQSPQYNSFCPVGTVIAYAGTSAPPGWLLCGGQTVSRATYSNLFATLLTTYGAGDGSNTFTLPDLRGRVVAGKDDMVLGAAGRILNSGAGTAGMDGTVLGAAGGLDRHTLINSEMPIHNHSGSTTTVTNAYPNAINHSHREYSDGNGGSSGIQVATTTSSGSRLTSNSTDTQNTDHKHSIQNDGGGQAHSIVQPTIILNYLIKY
jgi:microcystin-dependent protein